MIKKDRWSYEIIRKDIKKDYEDFLCKETYNFTFEQATAKMLYEYWRQIEEDRSEKVMIFIFLALKGLEYGELYFKVEEEILKIIKEDRLLKLRDEFEDEEFEVVYSDLEKVKTKLLYMLNNASIRKNKLIQDLKNIKFRPIAINEQDIFKIKNEIIDRVYQDENDAMIKCFKFDEDFKELLINDSFDNIFIQSLFHTKPLTNFFDDNIVYHERLDNDYYMFTTNEEDIRAVFQKQFEFGGAMKDLDREESIKLSNRLYNSVSEGSELKFCFTDQLWNDYFFGVTWDRTYIIVNLNTGNLWIMCFTDTD